ncbi:outer membrane beta-barrel protein [Dyadobacter crusticola]|uniref:outer membrane beta-barrel protein n=1 Tax=Dyadobacter crusticola TaxID=292407 RepID=UPI001E57794C|nr:outer membrane beta-barrel protein [Dyadobacter crusticola]
MMDPSGINNFEEQWRKALSDASETPPKSIWENIEARLDEENEKGMVLPLWWQSKKLWLVAASVAALLVVGAGLWYSDFKNAGSENGLAVTESAKTSDSNSAVPGTLNAETGGMEAVADAENKKTSSDQQTNISPEDAAIASSKNPGNAAGNYSASKYGGENALARAKRPNVPRSGQDNFSKQPLTSEQKYAVTNAEQTATQPETPLLAQNNIYQSAVTPEMLAGRTYNELDVHFQQRYVFFKPDVMAEEEVQPQKHKEYWAGIGLMPASFNPNVQVKQTPQAFSYQALSNMKAVSGTSEAGVSYALQTQGGMRLSKHWSVELGLSYLQGNSSYEGGGYLLNAYNQSANVLENALADASPRPSFSAEKNFNNGAAYIDVAKRVSNNYQYLQMPVQAGFTLNPDKKLSYSLLGGMMANFFLSNELEAASGEIITTKVSDEIYKSMNWAATTGLRFNYRLSSQWKASLTGSYQKSVSSSFRSNQTLDARPYLYGISWGVRYSF